MKISLKHGDTKNPLIVKLTNDKGVIDLTGCTVKFLLSNYYQTEVVVDGIATITDALNGIVEYPIRSSEIEPGMYRGEFEITFSDGKVEIFPKLDQIYIDIFPNLRDNSGGETPPTLPNGVIDGGSF